MPVDNFRRALQDDGLYTPDIKEHSLEKIRIHNYYISLFTTAMNALWPQRAYLGLFSGPGRARLKETGEIVETTAISAFRQSHPFTKYIFVDNDAKCINALERRVSALSNSFDVTFIRSDVKAAIPQVIREMPQFGPGNGLLSFCFIDPFSAALEFDVIKTLSRRYRMDFLILLMLGRDVRTNFRKYLDDPSDTRIAALIDDPNWRSEWRARDGHPRDLIRFLLGKFDSAMTQLGYQAALPADSHPVRVLGKRVFLYSLVFYSKSRLGKQFWETTRKGADPQTSLGL